MTKKLKSSLIVSFFFLFGLMAALCAGAFSPALTPAKADTTYKLTFYEDTSFSNTIKEISGAGDTVITEEMMNFGIPEKESKVFSGWSQTPPDNPVYRSFFVNKTLRGLYTEYFDASSVTPTEMTYFVVYSTAYTLTFYDTDNTTALKTLTGAADTVITEEMMNFQVTPKSGYEFKGWYTFANAGMYQPLVGLTMGSAATMSEPNATSSSFYPQFEQETTYTLTFKDGETTLKTYTYKQGYHLILVNVASDWAKSGYKILGISETPDGEITAIAFDTAISVTADKTYYVRYQKIQTLTIKIGDTTETATVPADTAIKIKDYVSADKLKKDGYILKGFALAENGEVAYDYDTTPLKLTADLTLYAVYEKANVITVIADGEVKFTATAEKGKTLDLGGAGITSIMTKEGYTLKGYATAENGEIVYEANAVITPESDLTLYAVYEETKTPGDDSGNIGDKVNDVSNKISEWLKSKTGIALSSSGVIVLAVVLVLILFKRK